jgi:chemotaxis protein CheX
MERIQTAELVTIIHSATDSVFSTMLGLPAVPQTVRQETGDPSPVDGVIALVGIAGSWTGTGQIYCSAEFACKLASALLMTEYSAVDGDVLDAVAEVSNMIIGNVKTNLEETLGPLGLGVPTVIYGRNYQARTGSIHEWTVIPFLSGEELMQVRFCLTPTPATAPRLPQVRPEPALA